MSDVIIHRLRNGLTLLIDEFHYAPVAAVVMAYRVGSRNEMEATPLPEL